MMRNAQEDGIVEGVVKWKEPIVLVMAELYLYEGVRELSLRQKTTTRIAEQPSVL